MAKNLPASAGGARDARSIPGSGRAPVGGNDDPLQYSCLENPMDRGAWLAIAHGVSNSRTRLSDRANRHSFTLGLFKLNGYNSVSLTSAPGKRPQQL